MTAQIGLFDQPLPTTRRVPAREIMPNDAERLGGQCAKMLTMLRARPQLNSALVAIANKYTSRISDLRALGFEIKCTRVEGGLTLYTLVGEPK